MFVRRTLSGAGACTQIFAPVVIGDREPPLQTMELRNPCADDVLYTVDLAAVDALNAEAWDFPVLTCKNPRGRVPAVGTASGNWMFQPVEERRVRGERAWRWRDDDKP